MMQRGRVLQCQGIVIAMLCMFGRLEPAWGAVVVNFEDLALAPESYCNGSDGAGGFTSGEAFFNNSFTDFGGGFFAWSGWSYSNVTDNSTPGFDNQYSAIAGSGANGSSNYAVGFPGTPDGTTIELPQSMFPESLFVTNATYAYYSMLDGDAFAKQFGGQTGDDPDYFLLTITGLDDTDELIGTVDFYLADYRFDDNHLDYIVDGWTEVDLTTLHGATVMSFTVESSDVGPYGINTPTYFAIDDLKLVPEPATLTLWGLGALLILVVPRRRQPRR